MSDSRRADGAGPGDGPDRGRKGRDHRRAGTERAERVFRLNLKAALGLTAAVVLAGVVYTIGVRYNDRAIRGQVFKTVDQLEKTGKLDLAIRNLGRYLETHPDDIEALERQARITAESAQTIEEALSAARINDQLLRRDPNGPGRRETRRRLVSLYIKCADAAKLSAMSRNAPEMAVLDQKYQTARVIAEQLVYRPDEGDDAKEKPRQKNKPDESKGRPRQENKEATPGDHKLLAMALEGLAVPGNREALAASIREYELALRGDPGDMVTAERLALLYLDREHKPEKAREILDRLLASSPDAAVARLARYNFFARTRQFNLAAAELDEAIRLDGSNVAVRLTAATDALRRADTAAARAHLAAIPEKFRDDLRVKVLQGKIDFDEERPDEAILGWRQGLMTVNGTDAELTWWMAHAFLRMGDVASARRLVDQYRRLIGDEDDPLYQFLLAEREEVTGRPTRAIAILDKAKDKLPSDFWQGMAYLTMGRCYEATSDRGRALSAYQRANRADPGQVEARVAAARLLGSDPEEAVQELQRGLALEPDDPSLQMALVGALLRHQAARPLAERSWKEFDRAMSRALSTGTKGLNASLLIYQAERLILSNDLTGAIGLLEKVVAEVPPPRSPAIWIMLAEAQARAGRYDEASKTYERASRPDAAGDRAPIRMARARLLLARGRGREAHDLLERAARELPTADRPTILEALGRLDASRGDVEKARAAFAEWGRLLPEDPRPRLALLDLAEAVGDEAALHATVESLRTMDGPNDVAWRLSRALELLRGRPGDAKGQPRSDPDLGEADRLVRGVLTDAPELPGAHLLKGRILERQGKPLEARDAYLKALEGKSQAALPRLVDLLTRLGRLDEIENLKSLAPAGQLDRLSAVASFRAGNAEAAERFAVQAARDASGPDAPAWQARMLETIGHRDRSEAVLRATAERQPAEIRPWADLIASLARHGKAREVAETIEVARSKVKPDDRDLAEARFRWAAGDRDAADRAFQAAVARKPADVALRLAAADYFEESGQADRAIDELKAALKLDPKKRPTVQRLAVLLAAGPATWGEAERLIGAETSPGDEPTDRLARGMVLAQAGDPARKSRAVDVLTALVEDLPANSPVAYAGRTFLIRLLLDTGQAERARGVAALLASSGDDATSLGLYIECLLRTRNYAEALRQVDRLDSIDPGSASSADFRVRGLREAARPGEAAKALEKAVRDGATRPETERFARAAFASITSQDLAALDEADSVARTVAGFRSSASWMLGRVQARRGQLAEALELCRASVGADVSDDRRGAAEVAMEVATTRDVPPALLNKAVAIADAALVSDPADPTILTMGAMVRRVQGRFEDEARLYRAALRGRPHDPLASNNLAWVLSENLGQPGAALPLLDDAIAHHGRLGWMLDTRGVVLTRLGRLDEAIIDLKESAGATPPPVVLFHLARACQKAHRDQEFRRYRDEARRARISAKEVDLSERGEFESLMAL